MRYIIVALIAMTMLALGAPVSANDHTWQRPSECEDKDRQVPGNRSTPCKYVLPVLEKIEYEVRIFYPKCWEVLYFRMPGMKPLSDDFPSGNTYMRWLPNDNDLHGYGNQYQLPTEKVYFGVDAVARTGYSWGLGDGIRGTAFGTMGRGLSLCAN